MQTTTDDRTAATDDSESTARSLRRTRRMRGRHRATRPPSRMAPRSLVITTTVVVLAAIGAGAWWGVTTISDIARGGGAAQRARTATTGPAATGAPPATNADGSAAVPVTTAPPERHTLSGVETVLAESLVPPDLPKMAEGRSYRIRPEPEVPIQRVVPETSVAPPEVTAERAVVMDARTGAVLWSREDDLGVSVGSTLKMLTALVALRWTDSAEPVTIGKKPTQRAEDSAERTAGLVEGEQVAVRDLLGAMLVGSANDAASALGEFVSGADQGRYNDAAQKLAKRLGTRDTTVRNATGMDQSGQFSNAYDLAVLARAGLADPQFRDFVQSTSYRIPGKSGAGGGERSVENRNPLLGKYEGAIGVKTGSTPLAGDCLVAAATRNGRTYIAVALKSDKPADDTENMLTWAFDNWATVEVAQRRTEVIGADGTKGIAAAPLAVSVPAGTESQVRTYVTAEAIEAEFNGEVLSSVPRVRAAR